MKRWIAILLLILVCSGCKIWVADNEYYEIQIRTKPTLSVPSPSSGTENT